MISNNIKAKLTWRVLIIHQSKRLRAKTWNISFLVSSWPLSACLISNLSVSLVSLQRQCGTAASVERNLLFICLNYPNSESIIVFQPKMWIICVPSLEQYGVYFRLQITDFISRLALMRYTVTYTMYSL